VKRRHPNASTTSRRRSSAHCVVAVVLYLAMSTAGCGRPGNTSVPSHACGGFQLEIVNDGARPVDVSVDGAPAGRVQPGRSLTIVQYGNPALPPMPWRVVLARAKGGVPIATVEVAENPDGGATLHVDDPAVVGPAASRGC